MAVHMYQYTAGGVPVVYQWCTSGVPVQCFKNIEKNRRHDNCGIE